MSALVPLPDTNVRTTQRFIESRVIHEASQSFQGGERGVGHRHREGYKKPCRIDQHLSLFVQL